MTLAERRWLRLFALCTLYVAQGIPYGFVTVTLAAYLAGFGASTDEVGGLVALATLPWAFKWVWGPLIDRYSRSAMGRRRPWILTAQALMVVGACALIAIPELRDDQTLLGVIVLAINVCASLQDVSVDAMAVDLLPERERGVANGMMYGGSYVGVILGGAMLSTVVGRHGLRSALIVQVLMLAAIMLVPLLLRERSGDRVFSLGRRPLGDDERGGGSTRELLANLWRAFARRSPAVGVLLALAMEIGFMTITTVATVLLMQKLGWSQEEYGQMIGGFPLVFGLAGSVGGGWIADRIGHRRTVAISTILLGITWLAFAASESSWTSRSFVVTIWCAGELAFGILSASLFALFMDLSWPRVAATQFTAFMALLNLSRTIGSKLAGPAQEALGFVGTYVACGVLQIAVVVLLLPIDPHQNRRELGDQPLG